MAGQKIQGDQLVLDGQFKALANYPRQELNQVIELIDNKITYPAKVEHLNVSGTDAVLQIHPSPIARKYGTSVSSVGEYIYESLPAINGVLNSYPGSFLNLANGSVTGAIDVSSVSGTTNGYYRWMLIYANSVSGSFGVAFGEQQATAPSFGTAMPAIPDATLPLTFVRLQNSGGGLWNFVRPQYSDIYNLVRGGGGGGGGGNIIQEVWTITSPQVTFTLTDIVPNANALKCYHVQTGQVYTCGVSGLTIAGQNVSFPANSFDYVTTSDVATLIFEQSDAKITRITH